MFWARRHVNHLEAEISYLRKQVEHERDRAERLNDELLRVRVQVGPVSMAHTPPPVENIVDQLLKNTEWATAGQDE